MNRNQEANQGRVTRPTYIYGKRLSHKGTDPGNRAKNGIGVFRNVSPVLPTNPCISKYD